VNRRAPTPISVAEPVEGTRANAYRVVRRFADEWLASAQLMILNAAIYCTLVVQDIVIVRSAEPWLTSRGENTIASSALNYRPDRAYSALRIFG